MASNLRQLKLRRHGRAAALAWALGTLTGVLVPLAASAQALVDPTRPPADTTGTPGVPAARSVGPMQTIKTSPGGTMAVVNGQIVKVGDSIGEARVVRISDTAVVLAWPGGVTDTVKLHARVDKRAAVPGIQQPGAAAAGLHRPTPAGGRDTEPEADAVPETSRLLRAER